jgi:acyl-coenzyme A synthetase/AMP-(fatty) acid ligase
MSANRAELRAQWYEQGYFCDETLWQFMSSGAQRYPEAKLLYELTGGREVATLGAVLDRARQVAGGLRAAGLTPGDVVLSQVPTSTEGAVLFAACAWLGLTVIPVIHIYGPGELSFILRDSQARALVLPDRWRRIDYLDRIERLGDDRPELVVVIGETVPPGAVSWHDLESTPAEPLPADVRPDDTCLTLYTSGTSARPKAVRHSHNSVRWEVVGTTRMASWDNTMTLLNPAPAGHMSGLLGLLRPFAIGATSVFMDSWNPDIAVQLIDEFGINACTSPSQLFLTTLLDAAQKAGSRLPSLREYAVGGSTVSPAAIIAADAYGIAAYRTYGSSEHPTVSTGVRTDDLWHRAHTDGRLTPGCTVRILDDHGGPVPADQPGEIAVIGPEQMLGYGDAKLDDACFSAEGYFLTNDIGSVDADGYLTISDRKKDIIIRGGENLSSREIEQIVCAHPAVADAAAVSVPDDRYGESVGVFVVPTPGAEVTLEQLRAHFTDADVAPQKTPEHLVIMDELPRTPSGKVKKAALRAIAQEQGRLGVAGSRESTSR